MNTRKKWLVLGMVAAGFWQGFAAFSCAGGLKNKGKWGLAGWVIYWDQDQQSLKTFEKYASVIDRAYAEWYKCGPDGLPEAVPDATEELKERTRLAAKKGDCQVWVMLGNWSNEIMGHDAKRIQKFLYDDALRKKHIQRLIEIARKEKVEGIQIDYENLLKTDKEAYARFMKELSRETKKAGLLLGIAVHPKTDPVGTWDGPQAVDYKAIGAVVDEFVPMTYDFHWSTSGPGAVSPPEWSEMVIHYTVSEMASSKVELGIPLYGYDWVGNKGGTMIWKDLVALLRKHKIKPKRDEDYSYELFFRYSEGGKNHEAWFPDAGAFVKKLPILENYGLAGIACWYFGAEDPRFWQVWQKAAHGKVLVR